MFLSFFNTDKKEEEKTSPSFILERKLVIVEKKKKKLYSPYLPAMKERKERKQRERVHRHQQAKTAFFIAFLPPPPPPPPPVWNRSGRKNSVYGTCSLRLVLLRITVHLETRNAISTSCELPRPCLTHLPTYLPIQTSSQL